jgi:hypothetical protein
MAGKLANPAHGFPIAISRFKKHFIFFDFIFLFSSGVART